MGEEVRRLREALDGPPPTLSLLVGPPSGRGPVLRAALEGRRVVLHRAAPLPEDEQRMLLADDVERVLGTATPPSAPLLGLVDAAETTPEPLVLALDEAHLWLGGGAGARDAAEELWNRLRGRALPVHVVLSGPVPELDRAVAGSKRLAEAVGARVEVLPLGLRTVAGRLARWSPVDRLRGWAAFGGRREVVARVDPSRSLRHNLRTLYLEPDGPLHEDGFALLRGDVQSLPRYASLLRALATGAEDWPSLRRASDAFDEGNRMAPYVGRLVELGLVEVRRSLDAPPQGRKRRYTLRDPSVGFWYRCVLPHRSELAAGAIGEVEGRVVAALDAHLALHLPLAARQWMAAHADERLPAPARQVGALWGADYDLPVAGILRNGAPVYGTCHTGDGPAGPALFDDVRAQLRRTRFGFGREVRHQVVFSIAGFTAEAVRAAARDEARHAVGPSELTGETGPESFPHFRT